VTDDRLKNLVSAAIDLADRAQGVIDDEGSGAREALVTALKNFRVAHQSLRDAAFEALAGHA
jgi:hypothetical protein